MKAQTMGNLVINDKPQYLPVGFGTLSNVMPGLKENTITVIFDHDVPADYVDSEYFQEERMFRVLEQGSGPAPSGYIHIGHVILKGGRQINVFGEPDYRNKVKKEAPVKTVHRDYLAITPAVQTKNIGQGALLHAAEDRQGLGRIDIWYEVDTNVPAPVLARNFVTIQTGETLTLPGYTYFTTVVMQNGQIFHIYAQYGF